MAPTFKRFDSTSPFAMAGTNSTGLHEFRFVDGVMILTDRQVTTLASGMGVAGQSPPDMAREMKALLPRKIRYWVGGVRKLCVPVESCTWNMAFRRRYELHRIPWLAPFESFLSPPRGGFLAAAFPKMWKGFLRLSRDVERRF